MGIEAREANCGSHLRPQEERAETKGDWHRVLQLKGNRHGHGEFAAAFHYAWPPVFCPSLERCSVAVHACGAPEVVVLGHPWRGPRPVAATSLSFKYFHATRLTSSASIASM